VAAKHIQDVPCNALGYLPKKLENYKKLILVEEKSQSVAPKNG
jgi:hypothetical protein